MSKRYETLTVTVLKGNIERDLNVFGDKGWHVVAGFMDEYNDFKFVLQRLKTVDATPEMAR
jgi:hypothetical protein